MKYLFRIISVVLLTSCTSGYIVTTNLHNLANYEDKSQIYTLPQTRVLVTVNVTKTDFIPGPYYKYAKTYLGIESAQSSPTVSYVINDIHINTQSIPDPDFCYSVRDENFDNAECLIESYRKSGLILKEIIPGCQMTKLEKLDSSEDIEYSDVMIKPFFNDENIVKKALSPVSGISSEELPLWQRQVAAKTIEQKAEEAAKFIFKIRKRRFKLLAGQYEVFPNGIALETAIDELNKLEQEYLSLFIGKEKSISFSRKFSVVPSDDEKLQRFTLFRFSEKEGLLPAGGEIGEAVILQLKDLETNQTLSELESQYASTQNENILLIRLPDKANAKVYYGSHVAMESEIPVYQFGALIPKYVPPVKKGLF